MLLLLAPLVSSHITITQYYVWQANTHAIMPNTHATQYYVWHANTHATFNFGSVPATFLQLKLFGSWSSIKSYQSTLFYNTVLKELKDVHSTYIFS